MRTAAEGTIVGWVTNIDDSARMRGILNNVAQNLRQYVWQTYWAHWIIYLLKRLDTIADPSTSAEILSAVQDSIAARLDSGTWDEMPRRAP